MALYGIGGTYTNNIITYEVSRIYIRNDKYGIREAIPSNGRFELDASICFPDKETALRYFDELTTTLKIAQQGHKAVQGVEENAEAVPECHFA